MKSVRILISGRCTGMEYMVYPDHYTVQSYDKDPLGFGPERSYPEKHFEGRLEEIPEGAHDTLKMRVKDRGLGSSCEVWIDGKWVLSESAPWYDGFRSITQWDQVKIWLYEDGPIPPRFDSEADAMLRRMAGSES